MELHKHRKLSLIKISFVLLKKGLGKGYGIVDLGNKILKGILHYQQGFFPVPDTGLFQSFKGRIKIKSPGGHNNRGGQNKKIKEIFP
jgi:hypothetical protein